MMQIIQHAYFYPVICIVKWVQQHVRWGFMCTFSRITAVTGKVSQPEGIF